MASGFEALNADMFAILSSVTTYVFWRYSPSNSPDECHLSFSLDTHGKAMCGTRISAQQFSIVRMFLT
jgi:hypothetical protein